MRYLIAAAAMLAASAAMADPVARDHLGDSVRFTQAECPAAIVAMVPKELQERLHKAYAHVAGQDFTACWIGTDKARYLIFEDGDQGVVPESDVHEEPEA